MAQKIIIPKGTLNPNETSVVEVPPHLQNSSVIVASTPVMSRAGGTQSFGKVGSKSQHKRPLTPIPDMSQLSHYVSFDSSGSSGAGDPFCTCVSDPNSSVSDPSDLMSYMGSPTPSPPRAGPSRAGPSRAGPSRPPQLDLDETIVGMESVQHSPHGKSHHHHRKVDMTYPPAKTREQHQRQRDLWDDSFEPHDIGERWALWEKMGIEDPLSQVKATRRKMEAAWWPEDYGTASHKGAVPAIQHAIGAPYRKKPSGVLDFKAFKKMKRLRKALKRMRRLRTVEAAEHRQLDEDVRRLHRTRRVLMRDTHEMCALM